MFRQDFYKKGFPINNINPVLCFNKRNNDIIACYNHYDLKVAIKNIGEDNVTCLGVFIGKYKTDIFELDPLSYINVNISEECKDIVNAQKIIVIFNNNDLIEINYINRRFSSESVIKVVKKDLINLFNYIKDNMLPYEIKYINPIEPNNNQE